MERVTKRAKRRAAGIVIRTEAATCNAITDVADVRLRGFQGLRRIFPEVPQRHIIGALNAVSDTPVDLRAAKAARVLMRQKLTDSICSSDMEAPRPPLLRRTKTSIAAFGTDPLLAITASPGTQPSRLQRTNSEPASLQDAVAVFGTAVDWDESSCFDEHMPLPIASRVKVETAKRISRACQKRRGLARPCAHLQEENEGFVDTDTVPIHSQRAARKFKDSCRKSHWKSRDWRGRPVRKYRRPEVSGCEAYLLRLPTPPDSVLHALDLAKAEAAAAAASETKAVAKIDSRGSQSMQKHWDVDPWGSLQDRFVQLYGGSIRRELGASLRLEPVHPSQTVQDSFLGACGMDMPKAAYHGTASRNIVSISEHGLLIPGQGGVKVVHGSAHGLGIYTAKLGASYLSRSFCDSDKMFICGVSDKDESRRSTCRRTFGMGLHHRHHHKPAAAARPNMIGNLKVHKDGTHVRHVGNAMVVFDKSRVAPLFVASNFAGARGGHGRTTSAAFSTTRIDLALSSNPNRKGRPEWVGRRQVLVEGIGKVVWRPPEELSYRQAKYMRRRVESKRRDIERRACRDQKHGILFAAETKLSRPTRMPARLILTDTRSCSRLGESGSENVSMGSKEIVGACLHSVAPSALSDITNTSAQNGLVGCVCLQICA